MRYGRFDERDKDDWLCICGHTFENHGRKRCMGLDSYGIRCECDSFERAPDPDEEDEDFDESDPHEVVQRRAVAQTDELLYGYGSADFYADKAREAPEQERL